MLDQPDTEHKKYKFKVSEYGDGTAYISTDPVGGKLSVLKHCSIFFNLPDGTSYEDAQKIATYLNDNLVSISTTLFGVDV